MKPIIARTHSVSVFAIAALVSASGAAAQVQFVPLGDLPGGDSFSKATGVSDDGRYVAGASVGSGAGFTPVRWDGTTAVPLVLPAGFDLGASIGVPAVTAHRSRPPARFPPILPTIAVSWGRTGRQH